MDENFVIKIGMVFLIFYKNSLFYLLYKRLSEFLFMDLNKRVLIHVGIQKSVFYLFDTTVFMKQ
jgi:hypothetical protein